VIVLDTNVLSEPLRLHPDDRVLTWLSAHSDGIALTAITVAELRYGALRLPQGGRRSALIVAIDDLIESASDRVLPFDSAAAEVAGQLRVDRESVGRVVSEEDTMIAAICLAGGHELATRNSRDFDDTVLTLHDPWGE